MKHYQYGLVRIRSLGCKMSVYRDLLDKNLKEGDEVTFHLNLDNYDVAEADIPAYVEQAFGIKLTQTVKTIKVHFEEDDISTIDPFEEGEVYFIREGTHFNISESLQKGKGFKNLTSEVSGVSFSFEPSLSEGIDINDLYIGDKVKFTLKMRKSAKDYTGEDINTKLNEGWTRINIEPTEKEFVVMPGNASGRYSSNVNVMLKRPDEWYEIVSDKNRFTKYDLRHIDGSTATIPITAELVRQFCGVEDDLIEYYIDHNTTGPAYEKLIKGLDEKNLIIVTEPSDDELAMAAENNVELDVTKIALDGFVFITHKDNPVESLTIDQIRDIYSGNITNWSEVGGYDEEIVPYIRDKNSGSQTAMENLVMQGTPMITHPETKIQIAMEMGGLIDSIATYSNSSRSIGFTFNYYLNNLYQNEDVKVLRINDVYPDNENLIDGSYPLSSGYYAVTVKGRDAKADEIKDYLLSEEGQEIVKLAGYCPVG